MMSMLSYFDPGNGMTGLLLVVIFQTSVVIVVAKLLAMALFRWRAEARHALWLGVLGLVLISPAVAVAARRSGLAFWAIALPVTSQRLSPERGDDWPSHEPARVHAPRLVPQPSTGSVLPQTEPVREASLEPAQFDAKRTTTSVSYHGGSALIGALTLLWLVGVLVGLARIALGWTRLAAICRSAHALDPERHVLTLERVREALGIVALPPVVTSTAVRAPVAVGVWKPRVVLPEGLAESLASDALRDVLVHECAHVVRHDGWVGLLQRLVGTLFWPHPLVHYASSQLTRAREEVCDNHVLRCGSPGGYARTLLALTEQCLPMGAARPGLGILGARWTLAERVAGLLDTRRIPMTHTTFRMKIAVCVLLAVMGIGAASVRLDGSARADGPQAKPFEPQAVGTPTVWSVEGTVVDERGQPVAGAIVRAVPEDVVVNEPKTGPDGRFILPLEGRRLYIWGVVAETEGAAGIGLVRFEDGRGLSESDPVRVMLKASRAVTVRVNDAAGSAVAGAAVEAIESSFRTHATTGPAGTATLRVAADAKVTLVIGLKGGFGFDYFENYSTFPAADYPPLPANVTLILDGAETVRVNAVDSARQPVSGVEIGLGPFSKIGKVSYVNVGPNAAARATTDREGFASFDWLPKTAKDALRFHVANYQNYSSRDLLYYQRGGPTQLTARVLRDTRLSGTVRFPDGLPAGGVLIEAEGGTRSGRRIQVAARTQADGSYVLDAPSESAYIVAFVDKTWAAPSISNVIVREGRPQGGLDLTLTKGTLLHGQLTEPPDHRPVAGATVYLSEEGGPLPRELRGSELRTTQIDRVSNADANGRYQFRIGPGRFSLRSPNAGGTEPLSVEVKSEAEVVRDLTLKGPARQTYVSGVVIEKTPTGDRPVPRATVHGLRAGFPGRFSIADDQGRFRMLRAPGEWYLYGASRERSLAGLMPVTAAADNVSLVVSTSPTITGRVIDSQGTPLAARVVGVRIDTGPNVARAGRLGLQLMTDNQGRYNVSAAPVGSHIEVSVSHQAKPSPTAPLTVVRFDVVDTAPVVITDLIVPVEKPTK
jgi:beta-lactamase regulating signal transducer with metallopeptidase domain